MPQRFKTHRKAERKTFDQVIRDEFDYDVSALPAYVDEQSPEVIADLVSSGNLKSRISIMDNVKGSKLIKLKTSAPSLQAANTCGWNASGGIVLTDKTISTSRVKIQEEYCNEDLIDVWPQIELMAGANTMDEEAPDFADTMIMYYQQRAQELDENLIWNGDTDSADSNLAHYDGLIKQWKNDDDVHIFHAGSVTIDETNAYDQLKNLDGRVPNIVKRYRSTVGYEIVCGRNVAEDCLAQIWEDKDYNGALEFTDEDGSITFMLPATQTRVRSYPELDDTQEVWGVPYGYIFYATDLESDIDDFGFRFNYHDEHLRFGVKWFSGISYVYGQYFTRLLLAAS